MKIEKIYNRSQEKYLDMGHLQVLILKNQLVQSEYWKELLAKDAAVTGGNSASWMTENSSISG